MGKTNKKIKIIDIAKAVGKSHSTVSSWFNEQRMPSIQDGILLEKRFGIPIYAWQDIKTYVLQNQEKFGSIKILREHNSPNLGDTSILRKAHNGKTEV